MILIIYLIGVIITYIICRYKMRKSKGHYYSMSDVGTALLISIFSWLSIFIFIVYLISTIFESDKKPPKWL